MDAKKVYRVKILDFKYLSSFDHLNFWYLTYEVTAKHEKEAIKKARKLYMNGDKELFSEELPFLLKLFSVGQS
jgi:hypothetical protein